MAMAMLVFLSDLVLACSHVQESTSWACSLLEQVKNIIS